MKVFYEYDPTENELKKAKKFKKTDCPRRYCWFWHSLRFDFELPIDKGCNLANEFPFNVLCKEPIFCRRRTGNISDKDLYERREPYLMKDGFEINRFDP